MFCSNIQYGHCASCVGVVLFDHAVCRKLRKNRQLYVHCQSGVSRPFHKFVLTHQVTIKYVIVVVLYYEIYRYLYNIFCQVVNCYTGGNLEAF